VRVGLLSEQRVRRAANAGGTGINHRSDHRRGLRDNWRGRGRGRGPLAREAQQGNATTHEQLAHPATLPTRAGVRNWTGEQAGSRCVRPDHLEVAP
jgi:hypothetical protein